MKFSISQKQKITLGAFLTLGLLIPLSILVMSQNRDIFFESQESKSLFGNPVFNKIKF